MPSLFAQSELRDLIDYVEKGQRLDADAGLRMINSQEILALGYMANIVRERKNGNQTFYMVNRPVDYADMDASFDETEKRLISSMVYGNQESLEERIGRLVQLRTLQDQTKEFLAFSPIPFYSENIRLEGIMGVGTTTGYEDLKMLSISRILLDNFDHIKAYWMMLGPKLAQASLAFGVDDLDGTVLEGEGQPKAEVELNNAMSKRALIHLIQKAGRDAVERDSQYRYRKID